MKTIRFTFLALFVFSSLATFAQIKKNFVVTEKVILANTAGFNSSFIDQDFSNIDNKMVEFGFALELTLDKKFYQSYGISFLRGFDKPTDIQNSNLNNTTEVSGIGIDAVFRYNLLNPKSSFEAGPRFGFGFKRIKIDAINLDQSLFGQAFPINQYLLETSSFKNYVELGFGIRKTLNIKSLELGVGLNASYLKSGGSWKHQSKDLLNPGRFSSGLEVSVGF